MANIIPMAGEGSRFQEAGYPLPKPLIEVSGKPMILSAIEDMPDSDKWIFLVRKEHIDKFNIDKTIKSKIPDAIIIPVDKTTDGQATTCMLAEPYIKDEEPVFIGSCDVGFFYNMDKFKETCQDSDAVVLSYTQREALRQDPEKFGWCILEDDKKTIKGMSVKKPISDDPYNDHIVTGSFFFKRFADFKEAYNLMRKEDYRVNNEFYVDSIPIFMKKLGKKALIFDVDLYPNWGTPAVLEDYNKIEMAFKDKDTDSISEENRQLLPLWAKYFKGKNAASTFNKCIICGSTEFTSIILQKEVPASVSRLKEELTGELDIVSCNRCSHIFNRAFDPAVIERVYNNEEYSACLPITPAIIERLQNIATNVIGEEHIKDKQVIEVGSMDFTFSEMLLNIGAKKIIAFEPSTLFKTENPKIEHIRDYLTKEGIKDQFPKADLIIYRHVFEHLTEPFQTLKDTIQNMKVGSLLYIEVPNVNDILEKKRVYDFFYEHISYFSPDLLEFLQKEMGADAVKIQPLINGQHFGMLTRKKEDKPEVGVNFNNIDINRDAEITVFKSSVERFDAEIDEIVKSNDNVAIYGAGAHSIVVTTRLNLNHDSIRCLFDLSPIKVGTLSPICNIPIKKPTKGSIEGIGCIIIIASLHQKEIFEFLIKELEFSGKIYGTYPSISKLQ